MEKLCDREEELGVEPLLFRSEKSQMTWFGHLVRMPPRRLPSEVFRACPTGRRKAQDTLEGLCLSFGLETPQDAPGQSSFEEERLGYPA